MFVKLLIISAVILIPSLAFLSIRMLFKENGRFPETHISRNKAMRDRGIKCAQHNEIGCNPPADLEGCSTCGARRL